MHVLIDNHARYLEYTVKDQMASHNNAPNQPYNEGSAVIFLTIINTTCMGKGRNVALLLTHALRYGLVYDTTFAQRYNSAMTSSGQ